MKLIIKYETYDWWFWLANLLTIGVGLAGFTEGFWVAAAISTANVVAFIIRDQSLTAFAVQVRWVYLGLVLLAIWEAVFDPWNVLFVALFFGTVMVVFFDRCSIARVLVHMPWNRDVKLH